MSSRRQLSRRRALFLSTALVADRSLGGFASPAAGRAFVAVGGLAGALPAPGAATPGTAAGEPLPLPATAAESGDAEAPAPRAS